MSLPEATRLGIAVIDKRYRIVSVNLMDRASFKKTPGSFVGQRCFEVFKKRRGVCPDCPGRRAMTTGKAQSAYCLWLSGDGSRVPVHIRAFPTVAAGGQVTGFIELVEDIAERQRAEKELMFRDALHQTQQEASPDGILVVDSKGRMVSFNKRFIEMWDIPATVSASRSDEAALKAVLTKLADPKGFLARVNHLYRHRREKSHDEFRLKDGRVFDRHSSPMRGENGVHFGRVWFFRDITEQRNAEQVLRESESRLQSILDASSTPIFLKDLKGRYLAVNRRYEELFHVTRRGMRGKTDYDLFSPEYAAEFQKADRRAIEEGKPIEVEETVPQDDGLHTYLSVKFPLLDSEGHPYAVCGIATDISGRKAGEQALRESEARYRRFIETSQEAFGELDTGLRIVQVNDRFSRMLGYAPTEMRGLHLLDDLAHPDGRDEIARQLALRRKGASTVYEAQFRHRDGSRVWAIVSGSPILDADGRYTGAFAMLTDITARKEVEQSLKESEERFRALSTSAQDAIIMMDPGDRITFWSDAAERIFGHTRLQAVGKRCHSLIASSRHRPMYRKGLSEFLKAGKGPALGRTLELIGVRKGGEEFPVEISVSAVKLCGRWNAIGIVRDISERKRIETELRSLRARLVSSQETERQRLSRELHDGVGQILSGLKYSLQSGAKGVRQDGPAGLKAAELLNRAISEIRQISQNLTPSELSDLGLVPAIRTLFREAGERTGLKFDVRSVAIPHHLSPDLELALFRICQEALGNVGRHAQAKTVAFALKRKGDQLEMLIEDDGKGFRVRRRGLRFASKGLGLNNIVERAEMFGGTMELESKPGQGTRLCLRVPLSGGRRS